MFCRLSGDKTSCQAVWHIVCDVGPDATGTGMKIPVAVAVSTWQQGRFSADFLPFQEG